MTITRPGSLPSAITLVLFALFTAGAQAAPRFMHVGGLTTQPVGHYELCLREPSECRQSITDPTPVKLTRALWNKLIKVNNAIQPRTDEEMWGKEEYWSYPDGLGDCEDYVLEKRLRLIAVGVPAGNLLITVVRQPNGDGHAVLTVSTNLGDYVLDNLEPGILAWTDTGYSYLKRQSAQDSGKWVSINDARPVAVGSVTANR